MGCFLHMKNTNKSNVVTMSEADAISQGKRHTTKE